MRSLGQLWRDLGSLMYQPTAQDGQACSVWALIWLSISVPEAAKNLQSALVCMLVFLCLCTFLHPSVDCFAVRAWSACMLQTKSTPCGREIRSSMYESVTVDRP